MSRPEALQIANEMVDEWTDAKRNERGYVHDKWVPVDPNVRTTAVLRLAEFLLGPAPEPRVVPPKLYCNWCDDPNNPDPAQHPGGSPVHAGRPMISSP